MRLGIVLAGIDTHDDGGIEITGRGRDDDLPGTRTNMLSGAVSITEQARALHGDIYPVLSPG